MKEKRGSKPGREAFTKTDWEYLKNMTDDEIDFSDIPKTNEEFWKNAKLVMPKPKVSLGVRFDEDVVEWFKSLGPGYQPRMNAVLRSYMEHNSKKKK